MRYCDQWFIVVEDCYLDRKDIYKDGSPHISECFYGANVVLDLENNDNIRDSIEAYGMYLDENVAFPLNNFEAFVPGVYILSVNSPNASNTARLKEYIRDNISSDTDLSKYFDIRYNNFKKLTVNHLAIKQYNISFKNESHTWCGSDPIPMKAYCVSYDDDIITGLDIYRIIGYYYQYIDYFYLYSDEQNTKRTAMNTMKSKVSALLNKDSKNGAEADFIDYVIFDEFVTKDIFDSKEYSGDWFIVIDENQYHRHYYYGKPKALDIEFKDPNDSSLKDHCITLPARYFKEKDIFTIEDTTKAFPGIYVLSVNDAKTSRGKYNAIKYIRKTGFDIDLLHNYYPIHFHHWMCVLVVTSYKIYLKNASFPVYAYHIANIPEDWRGHVDISKIISYYHNYISCLYLSRDDWSDKQKKSIMSRMGDKLLDIKIDKPAQELFVDEFVTKDMFNNIEKQQKSIWDNPQDLINKWTKYMKKNIKEKKDMGDTIKPVKIGKIGEWDGSKLMLTLNDNSKIDVGALMDLDLIQKEAEVMAQNLSKKAESLVMWQVPKIKEVKFNYPATIVFWKDGTKTMVKLQEGDIFDSDKAIAMCFMKKMFFNEGKYYNEIKKHSIYKVKEEEFECPKCHKGIISPKKHDIIDLNSCSGKSQITPPMDTVWKGKCNECGFESNPARTKEDAILLIKDTITKYKKSHKNKKETKTADKATQDNDPGDACHDRDIATDLFIKSFDRYQKWDHSDSKPISKPISKEDIDKKIEVLDGFEKWLDKEEKKDVDKDYSEGSPVMQNGLRCSVDVSPVVDKDEVDNKEGSSVYCKKVDRKWEAIAFKEGSPEGEFSFGRHIWTDNNLDTYYSHGKYQYKFDPAEFKWYPVKWYTDKDEDINDAVGSFDANDIWKDGDNIYYSDGIYHYELDKATHKWKPKNWESKPFGLPFGLKGYRVWTDGEDIYYSGLIKEHQYILKDNSSWEEIEWKGDLKDIDGHYIWSDGTNTYYGKGTSQYIFDKKNNTWNPIMWWHTGDKCSHYAIYGCAVWTDGENTYYSDNNYCTYVLEKGTTIWTEVSWADNEPILLDGRDIWRHGCNIYHSHCEEHHRLQKLLHCKKWTANITSTPEIGKSIFTDTMILSKALKDSNVSNVTKAVEDSNATKVYDYAWKEKKWSGLDNFEGDNVWSDDNKIFYSNGSQQYILNKETSTWETIKMFTDPKERYAKPEQVNTNTELKLFRENIWTDGTDTYYSDRNLQYKLIRNTTDVPHLIRWVLMKWKGLDIFDGRYIWKDGNDIYYSDGNKSFILDKQNHSWSIKEFKGYKVYGNHIWTDGTNVYYSSLDKQYILDRFTSSWNMKQWDCDLSMFDSKNIWTDGNDIYFSLGYENQKVLDKSTSTWKDKFWVETSLHFPSIGSIIVTTDHLLY